MNFDGTGGTGDALGKRGRQEGKTRPSGHEIGQDGGENNRGCPPEVAGQPSTWRPGNMRKIGKNKVQIQVVD